MAELDKFKRRMIRSVARLLLHENRPENEVWDALSKESGCDCKLLWQRMRALTIKKLNRLLAADDKPDQVAAVARLTPTDWLLCDLILVHEDVDLIGRESRKGKPGDSSDDPEPLVKLYQLVLQHGIEDLSQKLAKVPSPDNTNKLAAAWTAVTAQYNARPTGSTMHGLRTAQRCQCSAMLMQRRWYQLKKVAREGFYKLWQLYRGNERLWETTQGDRPTKLHALIAQRFPHIVTTPFLDWEDQIEAGLVILPKDHERVKQSAAAAEASTSKEPEQADSDDLVVLEPEIETIELPDSDSEESAETNQPSASLNQPEEDSNPNSNQSGQHDGDIGNEDIPEGSNDSIADGLSNVKILETTHIPDITADLDPTIKIKVEAEDPSDPAVKRRNLSLAMDNYLESTRNQVEDETQDINNDLIWEKANDYLNNTKITQISTVESEVDNRASKSADVIKEKADAFMKKRLQKALLDDLPIEQISRELSPDHLIKEKTDAFLRRSATPDTCKTKTSVKKTSATKEPTTISIDDDEQDNNVDTIQDSDDLIKAKADEFLHKTKEPQISEEKLSKNSNKISQQKSKDVITMNAGTSHDKSNENSENESSEKDKFDDIIKKKAEEFVRHADFKKLVDEVKSQCENETADETENEMHNGMLDGMEIVDDGIEYFDDEEDDIIKLDIGFADHAEQAQVDDAKEETPAAFDLKLIMEPVVYTLKLDQMTVFDKKPFQNVNDIVTIEKALAESKPVSDKTLKDIKPNDSSEKLDNSKRDDKLENMHSSLLGDQDIVNRVETKINEFLAKTNTCKPFVGPKSMHKNRYVSDNSEVILDDLKVKLTSYLLRKPRRRSYNPIQLCKNPDFNTRLRRLTVGFFSSHNNRVLLKECKPLTIDLSKAFETKLVDGTMYLKSGEFSKAAPEQNDAEIFQTASVKPSTLSVQSLVDNSIQDDIKKPSVPTLPTVDLTGRDKKINLKDINEIRKINQRLQTAQVTPIRIEDYLPVDNELPTERPKPPEQSTQDNENPHVQSENNSAIAGTSTLQDLLMNDNDKETQPLAPTKKKQGRYKPPHLSGVMIGNQPNFKVWAPWNKPLPRSKHLDDCLITLDTLNKMINKVKGFDDDPIPIQKKGKNWKYYGREKERREEKKLEAQEKAQAKKKEEERLEKKETLKNQTVKDEKATVETVSVESEEDETVGENTVSTPKIKINYCCWAKEKAAKRLTRKKIRQKHNCKGICECCCRDQLLCMAVRTPIKKNPKTKSACFNASTQDELTGQGQLENACKSIEQVVHPSTAESQVYHAPIFKVYPGGSNTRKDASTCTKPELISATESLYGRGLPMDVTKVTEKQVSRTKTYTYKCVTSRETSTRIVVLEPPEHYFVRPMINVFKTDKSVQTDDLPPGDTPALANTVPLIPPIPIPMISQIFPPTSPPLIAAQIPTLGPPVITQLSTPQTHIVIDGSGLTPRLSVTQDDPDLSSKTSKMVYLSSKAIAKEPTGLPIYLGKNKILLTTIKFPPHLNKTGALKLSAETETAVVPETAVLPATDSPALPPGVQIALPPGVQLVLPANGELTYILDPGVILNTDELENLAHILNSVKGQIEASQMPQESELESGVTKNIIDAPSQRVPTEVVDTCQTQTDTQTVVVSNVDTNNIKPNIITIDIEPEHTIPDSVSTEHQKESGLVEKSQKARLSLENDKNTKVEAVKMNHEPVNAPIDSEQAGNSEKNTEVEAVKMDREPLNSPIDSEQAEHSEKNTEEAVKMDHEPVNAPIDSEQTGIPEKNTEIEAVQMDHEPLSAPIDSEHLGNSEVQGINVDKVGQPEQNKDSEVETVKSIQGPQDASSTPENLYCTEGAAIDIDEENQKDSEVEIIEDEPVSDSLDQQKDSGESSRGNLLMDLMAMSGISAEDTKVEESPKKVNMQTITSPTKESLLPELTPVTSLAELKYACEHNGQFFKLDFVTGVLVSINVCIKKNPKIKKNPSFYVSNTKTSVIDLTDDTEDVKERKKDPDFDCKIVGPVISSPYGRKLRPIRIRKAPPPQPPPTLVIEKPVINTSLTSMLPVKRKRGRPRKQDLNKIEVRIDMVDSDAPMEEEYLIDSDAGDVIETPLKNPAKRLSYLKKSVLNNVKKNDIPVSSQSLLKTRILDANSDESSDDEPLAIKARKIHVRSSVSLENANTEALEDWLENEDAEKEPELREEHVGDVSPEYPEPTEEPVDNMEMDIDEENAFEPTILENDTEDDADCILGV